MFLIINYYKLTINGQCIACSMYVYMTKYWYNLSQLYILCQKLVMTSANENTYFDGFLFFLYWRSKAYCYSPPRLPNKKKVQFTKKVFSYWPGHWTNFLRKKRKHIEGATKGGGGKGLGPATKKIHFFLLRLF